MSASLSRGNLTVSCLRVGAVGRPMPVSVRNFTRRSQVAPRDATTPSPGRDATSRDVAVAAAPSATSTNKPCLFNPVVLAAVACILLIVPPAATAAAAASQPVEPTSLAALVKSSISFILHLDVHLGDLIAKYGMTTYGILFAIVFAETGLVVTPLLPGDSLLFATGALAALGKLNIAVLLTVYAVAATLGDAVNYSIGKYLGAKAADSKLIKKEYMDKTESFYQKYGPKTIVLARFVPIVRTFAPFVAGVGRMAYRQFAVYNVVGALLWTGICTLAGYCFGNIPIIHDNFSLVVLGIIAVSVLPVVFEVLMAGRGSRNGGRTGRVQRNGGSLNVRFS